MDSSLKIAVELTVAMFLCVGCAPSPARPLQPDMDKYGCNVPPPDVFTSAGISVDFAQSTWGKVVTGDIKVASDPKVISLASQAATDARIQDYLQCLAINRDHFTVDQVTYMRTMASFMSIKPTAAEFTEWQRNNPFPGKPQPLSSGDNANEQVDQIVSTLTHWERLDEPAIIAEDERNRLKSALPPLVRRLAQFEGTEPLPVAIKLRALHALAQGYVALAHAYAAGKGVDRNALREYAATAESFGVRASEWYQWLIDDKSPENEDARKWAFDTEFHENVTLCTLQAYALLESVGQMRHEAFASAWRPLPHEIKVKYASNPILSESRLAEVMKP